MTLEETVAARRLGDPQAARWISRGWSRWAVLDDVVEERDAPRQLGVYRLRGRRQKALLYVGESEDIRKRLSTLKRALAHAASGMMEKTGHWAAPNLHARLKGNSPEVSWLEDAIPQKAERKGLECECIAAHRWQLGRNPDCQFVSFDRD